MKIKKLFPIIIDKVIEPAVGGVKKKVASILNDFPKGSVLVLCSGTGRQCALVTESQNKCFALDINFIFSAYSHSKYPSIPVLCGDAGKIPFKDFCFDAVVLTFAVHDKPPNLRCNILNESLRVLKQNGIIIISDIDIPHNCIEKISHVLTCVIELFSGHFSCGMDFLKKGGIVNLLMQHNLREINRINYKFRNSATIIVKKK